MRALRCWWHVTAISCCLLLFACSKEKALAPGEAKLTHILLQADWYAEPEHGGFYMALLKGYYRDAGLDVEIRPLSPLVSAYALVGTGQAQMGLGTSDNLLIARAQGVPLKAVFPYFQHDPQGVMYHKESGITKLQDLDGRTVMISPILHYVDFLERSLHIHMNMIPVDGSVAHFVQDKQFVQQAFLTSEPFAAMQGGAQPLVLPFWDTGYDPYRLVFTSDEFIQQHPEAVKAFIAATLRGWEEFLTQDKSEVFKTLMANNPAQNPAFMEWTFGKMQEYQVNYGHAEQGETLGQLNLGRLRTQIQQLVELASLPKPVTVEDIVPLQLYPAALVVP